VHSSDPLNVRPRTRDSSLSWTQEAAASYNSTVSRAFRTLLLVAAVGPGTRLDAMPGCLPLDDSPGAVRAVVVIDGAEDPAVAEAVRRVGANTLVAESFPTVAGAAAASKAGLRYMARVTSEEILQLWTDASLREAVRVLPNLSGFEYLDPDVPEGFSPPATQRVNYQTLKSLFPSSLVVTATRLDPIVWFPGYLDAYFRPEFSDLVVPYFYPVGTTYLGSRRQGDAWENDLRALLVPVAERLPAGKEVLPVLQGFEQAEYPVDARLVARQWDVYREIFPRNANVAGFWWGGAEVGPLTGMSKRPMLLEAFRRLFGAVPTRGAPCVAPGRSYSR